MQETSSGSTTDGLELWVAAQSLPLKLKQQNGTPKKGGRGKGWQHAIKTHCPKGHEYTQENTRYGASGSRFCRTCSKESYERFRKHNPERVKEYVKKHKLANPGLFNLKRKQWSLKWRASIKESDPQRYKKWQQQWREHYKNSKYQHRLNHLRRLYGLSRERYEQMLLDQNNLCAICKNTMKSPHVDHDHATGKVRSILCARCNHFVGMIETSGIELLKSIAAYTHIFDRIKE